MLFVFKRQYAYSLKKEAEELIADLGLNVTEAVNIFFAPARAREQAPPIVRTLGARCNCWPANEGSSLLRNLLGTKDAKI